jgi:hypothetical protein
MNNGFNGIGIDTGNGTPGALNQNGGAGDSIGGTNG